MPRTAHALRTHAGETPDWLAVVAHRLLLQCLEQDPVGIGEVGQRWPLRRILESEVELLGIAHSPARTRLQPAPLNSAEPELLAEQCSGKTGTAGSDPVDALGEHRGGWARGRCGHNLIIRIQRGARCDGRPARGVTASAKLIPPLDGEHVRKVVAPKVLLRDPAFSNPEKL